MTRLLYSEFGSLMTSVMLIVTIQVTPEMLNTAEFVKIVSRLDQRGELNRLVIDEAHCISVSLILLFFVVLIYSLL